MPPLFPLTLMLLAVACTLYGVVVAQAQAGRLLRLGRGVLLLSVLSQAADIGWLCLHGQHPAAAAREAVFFASFLISGIYLLFSFKNPLPVVGTLVLPVALFLQVASRLAPADAPKAASALRSLHIFSATLGLALFALAAGSSVIYLLTERQLKRHHLGQMGRRGPALSTLDQLSRRMILLGIPVFTLALVTGAVFLSRLIHNGEPAGLLRRPEYALSVLSWLLYAGLLLSRMAFGLRGRKAALLTLYGFSAALLVLLIYFLRALAGPGAEAGPP